MAARHLDHLHKEFADAAQYAAANLTRAATGKTSINSLGILQNSATQIDILAARRADAVEHLTVLIHAYRQVTTGDQAAPRLARLQLSPRSVQRQLARRPSAQRPAGGPASRFQGAHARRPYRPRPYADALASPPGGRLATATPLYVHGFRYHPHPGALLLLAATGVASQALRTQALAQRLAVHGVGVNLRHSPPPSVAPPAVKAQPALPDSRLVTHHRLSRAGPRCPAPL